MTMGIRDENADRRCGDDSTVRALMLGYCRGEREAFEGLYARVAPGLFAELIVWCGDRKRAVALLDRTFQTLHRDRSLFVEGADPLPWISEIARSEFVLDCRREARESRGLLWSRIRIVFRRRASMEAEARS